MFFFLLAKLILLYFRQRTVTFSIFVVVAEEPTEDKKVGSVHRGNQRYS